MLKRNKQFLMGAAVGSGMGAAAAEQAGADFLLALSAGRLRTMGVPSPASLLPIYRGTDFVVEFARTEILGRTKLPLFLGVLAFDPRIDPTSFLDRFASIGVSGVTNFPSLIHFGERREALAALGIGFDREIAFLKAAKQRGFATIGYVRTSDDAREMALADIDAICMNFVLNPGRPEAEKDERLTQEIFARSADILKAVRGVRPSMLCLLGGGPIASAADLMEYCRKANIGGFIGGSTLDQLPLERSLVDTVSAFRSIRELQLRVDQLEDRLRQLGRRHGLVAQSTAMGRTLQQAVRLAKGRGHILVSGEPGTGRETVAKLIVQQSKAGAGRTHSLDYRPGADGQFNAKLFGVEARAKSRRVLSYLEVATAIIIRCRAALPAKIRERIGHFMRTGQFVAEGGDIVRKSKARLIFVTEDKATDLLNGEQMSDPFAASLRGNRVFVPPLRDRLEDLPFLFKQYAGALSEDSRQEVEIENDALRELLRHNWPRNLIEFKAVVAWMVNERSMSFSLDDLRDRLNVSRNILSERRISERDLIVEALVKHNLRRGETAIYLGVSRKTLYNKIKKYQIFA